MFEHHAAHGSRLALQPDRLGPVADDDAVLPGEGLLVPRGAHRLGYAPVDQGDLLGAEQLRLDGDMDGGLAAADHHHMAADRQVGYTLGRASLWECVCLLWEILLGVL